MKGRGRRFDYARGCEQSGGLFEYFGENTANPMTTCPITNHVEGEYFAGSNLFMRCQHTHTQGIRTFDYLICEGPRSMTVWLVVCIHLMLGTHAVPARRSANSCSPPARSSIAARFSQVGMLDLDLTNCFSLLSYRINRSFPSVFWPPNSFCSELYVFRSFASLSKPLAVVGDIQHRLPSRYLSRKLNRTCPQSFSCTTARLSPCHDDFLYTCPGEACNLLSAEHL